MADVLSDACSIRTEEVQDLRSVITITGFPAPDGLASLAASVQRGGAFPGFSCVMEPQSPDLHPFSRSYFWISDVVFIRLSLLWGMDCLSVRLKSRSRALLALGVRPLVWQLSRRAGTVVSTNVSVTRGPAIKRSE